MFLVVDLIWLRQVFLCITFLALFSFLIRIVNFISKHHRYHCQLYKILLDVIYNDMGVIIWPTLQFLSQIVGHICSANWNNYLSNRVSILILFLLSLLCYNSVTVIETLLNLCIFISLGTNLINNLNQSYRS